VVTDLELDPTLPDVHGHLGGDGPAVLLLLLALEPLVGSLVPDLAPWLPSGLAAVIADPSVASDPDVGVAVATFAAYGLVATAAAALVLRRADVA
jgi:hypothetical protein